MTIAVITGANSGLGRAAAVDLAQRGWTVYGAMRSLDRGHRLAEMAATAGVVVHPVVCDITDQASVDACVRQVVDEGGRIDVWVNNAGIGGNGAVEEASIDTYREVMDVNVYGGIRCIQAVLPHMRERGSGAIVNVTSVAGRVALIGQSPYIASKWAFEAVSENLAQEVTPHGIRVVIVEPGTVKTAIMAKTTESPDRTRAYAVVNRRLFGFYRAALSSDDQTDPAEMGAVIHEAVTTSEPRLRWVFGWGAHEMLAARASITDQQWVTLNDTDDDADYVARFRDLVNIDLSRGFEE